ncbi:hypothetical protein L2E82_30818 [Cichorium intybus]|uniref:Uncharacterized protein n=1 Tax=Cichorium intybus TaxID=13427 RepID=A0ACB9D1E6_CICIN|nr:hypothetical protein L2E82_30818 [Cichorium intybus]
MESEGTHLLSDNNYMDEKPEVIDHSKSNESTLAMLFSPELIKPTLLLWVVFFGNAFSYYGLVLLTTELHNGANNCDSNQSHSQGSPKVSYKDVFITSFASLTTFLLFMARICITTTFMVAYIYAPEIYPTSVRTTGVGVGSSVGRIGGMICPLVAVGLIHGCHQTAAILLFKFVIFSSGVCVMLFPFETSGWELTDSTVRETTTTLEVD